MEAHLSAHSDQLLESLNFKASSSSSYITDRRDVVYPAESGNRFEKPGGQTLLRFRLADQGWLVPDSIRLGVTVHNNSAANNLKPLACPMAALFSRMRLIIGGQVVEDLSYLGRTVQMFEKLAPAMKKANHAAQGWGIPNAGWTATEDYDAILPNGEKRVMMTIPSGLLAQPKNLPLKYMNGGLVIELELADPEQGFRGIDGAANSFFIDQPLIYCTVLTLDSSLESSFAQHLLSGRNIPIYFSSLA